MSASLAVIKKKKQEWQEAVFATLCHVRMVSDRASEWTATDRGFALNHILQGKTLNFFVHIIAETKTVQKFRVQPLRLIEEGSGKLLAS